MISVVFGDKRRQPRGYRRANSYGIKDVHPAADRAGSCEVTWNFHLLTNSSSFGERFERLPRVKSFLT
jgi:hypothetical protein